MGSTSVHIKSPFRNDRRSDSGSLLIPSLLQDSACFRRRLTHPSRRLPYRGGSRIERIIRIISIICPKSGPHEPRSGQRKTGLHRSFKLTVVDQMGLTDEDVLDLCRSLLFGPGMKYDQVPMSPKVPRLLKDLVVKWFHVGISQRTAQSPRLDNFHHGNCHSLAEQQAVAHVGRLPLLPGDTLLNPPG